MGRLKIKKKETVVPFRETLAYRMMLVAGSIIAFIAAVFILMGAMNTSTVSFAGAAAAVLAAVVAVFYNLNHLRDARIPKRTINRMKRR